MINNTSHDLIWNNYTSLLLFTFLKPMWLNYGYVTSKTFC